MHDPMAFGARSNMEDEKTSRVCCVGWESAPWAKDNFATYTMAACEDDSSTAGDFLCSRKKSFP